MEQRRSEQLGCSSVWEDIFAIGAVVAMGAAMVMLGNLAAYGLLRIFGAS